MIDRRKLWHAAAVDFAGLLRLARHLKREGRLAGTHCSCGATQCTGRMIAAIARGCQ